MRPRIISLTCLLMAAMLMAAQSIKRHEYWLDADYGNRKTVNAGGVVSVTVSTAGLAPGAHFFNHRAQNTDDTWGTLYRALFYVPGDAVGQVSIGSYAYWIDNDYAHRVKGGSNSSVTATVDVSQLKPGLHFFHFLASDNQGHEGVLSRSAFFLPEIISTDVAKVEYWIDNDYAHADNLYINTAPHTNGNTNPDPVIIPVATVDISQLQPGLHFFNHRDANINGDYGCLRRCAFFVPVQEAEELMVEEYEYWIDDEAPTAMKDGNAQGVYRLTIDVSSLAEGEHTFSFRAKNVNGWGDVYAQKFTLTGSATDYVIVLEAPMRTFCANRDLQFADVQGLKAYTGGGFNTATGQVMMMRVGDVPAGTGLLLVGEPGTYHVPFNNSSTVYVNMLKGVTDDVTVWATEDGMRNYLLQGQAFQAVVGSQSLSAEHAYLQVPIQAAGKWDSITLHFDDASSVTDVTSDGQLFDICSLSGTLVKRSASTTEGLPRGIYIVNGHKIVIK